MTLRGSLVHSKGKKGMGIWGSMKPLGTPSTIESKGKDGKRKEKHIGNNNNRVKYFPLKWNTLTN